MSAGENTTGAGQYPAELECDVLLSDGRTARLRPIRPDDGPALRSLGGKLSTETVYFRFFSPRRLINDEEIAHYVTVDYHDRLALVAVVDAEMVAVARYDRCVTSQTVTEGLSSGAQPGPDEAEVAFVVRDDQQGRGLGTVLLEHLASAAVQRGIGRFVADTLPDNYRMINVFRSVGFSEHALLDSGVIRVTLELVSRPEYLQRVEERDWSAAVRSVEYILRPSSIAVVSSPGPSQKVGDEIVAHLVSAGFKGALYPVAADGGTVCGLRRHPDLADLPGAVDLAVVAVSRHELARVVGECGFNGTKGIVVVASGDPGETEDTDPSDSEIVELARTFGMRLVGPECIGVINTCAEISMNASLAEQPPPPGSVAFSSQSGGLAVALLGELGGRGLGISSFVSVGRKADVSGNDLLRFWAQDDQSEVILLYLESFGNPRKFSRIARQVARKKPIVAVKSARTAAGARGVRPQVTTVPDEAIDALFRQAGVIRVATLEELLEVADLLASQPLPQGRGVAIVGNAGGCGVLVADACESYGLEVPEFSPATRARLLEIVSAEVAIGNPLALFASATPAQYRSVLEAVLDDEGVFAAIVTFVPPGAAGADLVAEAVAAGAATSAKPVLANFTATAATLPALRCAPRRVPQFAYPESAARALSRVVPYAEWVRRPEGSVAVFEDVDPSSARRIVAAALEGSSTPPGSLDSTLSAPGWLETTSTLALLEAYRIPVLAWATASGVSEAVAGASALGYPVALKLDAPFLVHKSDIGGVLLNLSSEQDVAHAAEELLSRFGQNVGLVVQPMAPEGVETVVGLVEDLAFGPLVMFGLGGKQAELFGDQIWSLLPITGEDAAGLVRGLRSSRLLTGYRGSAPVDLAALAEVVSRVALLAEDLPEIAELSLNPVVASPGGAVVLDARVRVAAVRHEPPLMRRTMRTA